MANVQQQATGAVHIYVRPPGGSQPLYFGTSESFPKDTRNPEYEPVMNDISGSKVPLDFAWEGESAIISLVMTRVEQSIVELMQARPHSAGALPGSWALNDVGSLMSLEGLTWQIWLAYTFGAALGNKAAYVNQGMRAGRHYVQAIIWAPQDDETGTKPMKQHFLLYAWPKLNMTTRRFVLYDYDFTGVSPAGLK